MVYALYAVLKVRRGSSLLLREHEPCGVGRLVNVDRLRYVEASAHEWHFQEI